MIDLPLSNNLFIHHDEHKKETFKNHIKRTFIHLPNYYIQMFVINKFLRIKFSKSYKCQEFVEHPIAIFLNTLVHTKISGMRKELAHTNYTNNTISVSQG